VQSDGDEAILKLTLPGSEAYVAERARREMQFYLHLAGEIPLRVPRLMSALDDEEVGTAILLAAYEAAAHPRTWGEARFVTVAEQLAGFHAVFWNRTGRLAAYEWLRRPQEEATDEDIGHALDAWRKLRENEPHARILREQQYHLVTRLLRGVDALRAPIRSFPLTLCHGDFHAGNLLRDTSGRLVWADWQEVGLGYGPEDLSIFFQRAEAMGASPPRNEMSLAYRSRLEAETGEQIPTETLERAIDYSELWARVLYWPLYLAFLTEERFRHAMQRIEVLSSRYML
jgi:Ser/Thr protein kinase RdoA (MazF antagonist)